MTLTSRPSRRAVVLVAVLVVVAVLALIGYTFFRLMNAEADAARASNRLIQTRQAAESGLHYMAFLLAYPNGSGNGYGSFDDDPRYASKVLRMGAFYNHEPGVQLPALHAVPIPGEVPDAPPRGYFSIVSPNYDPDAAAPFRFGVEDENAKINLNAILQIDSRGEYAREVLTRLFQEVYGQSDQVLIANIINWARPPSSWIQGGDQMFEIPPKGAPYESLEELLRVKGMTPRMLLGNDLNRNGVIDPNEGSTSEPIEPGLQRYLTVYSRERNVDVMGNPRINVNVEPDTANNETWADVLQQLEANLTEALGDVRMAKMIVAYRIYGSVSASGGGRGGGFSAVIEDIENLEIDYDRTAENAPRRIESLFDLIGRAIEIPQPGTGADGRPRPPIRYPGPWPANDSTELESTLPLLLDKCTTTDQLDLPARINIVTAPIELLRAFPGMDNKAEEIVAIRPRPGEDTQNPEVFHTATWLLTRAGFNPQTVKQYEAVFTSRSQVYRMQSVGYHQLGGPVVRIEAVVDVNYGRPRFLYWRDLTDQGRGYDWRMYDGAVPP